MNTQMEYCYVGIKPCGCAVAFVFDDPNDKKWTSKHVASFIKYGYRVEHMETEQCRKILKPCKCKSGAPTDQAEPGLKPITIASS
jgi:hypothetical protein